MAATLFSLTSNLHVQTDALVVAPSGGVGIGFKVNRIQIVFDNDVLRVQIPDQGSILFGGLSQGTSNNFALPVDMADLPSAMLAQVEAEPHSGNEDHFFDVSLKLAIR